MAVLDIVVVVRRFKALARPTQQCRHRELSPDQPTPQTAVGAAATTTTMTTDNRGIENVQ